LPLASASGKEMKGILRGFSPIQKRFSFSKENWAKTQKLFILKSAG
jgi:hypothetical protein